MSSVSDTRYGPELPGDDAGRARTGRGRVRALFVAVLLTAVGLGAGTLLGAVPVVVEVVRSGTAEFGVGLLVTSLVFTMLGYALVGGLYARRYLRVEVRVPTRRDLLWTVAGLFGTLAAITILGLAAFSLGLQGAPNSVGVAGQEAPVFLLAVAVLSILLVGPAEELLFRGAIQGRLRESFGPVGAILGASILFGSIHLVAVVGTLGESLVSVGLITVVSLVLGYVYERTRNVVVPALVHGFYNATLLTLSYLAL
ncbi:CPBP family intramembrane metalloprotease [Salinirubellus salinus]|uniref:CPBP family intramembrane metalloprotease n=1 Tax=Salinirubellus salinus TaxID=1364945 RepID=A0A9E7R429_9EURY|nr:CPBP family intramembrane glutamic endopeptidase [Salinirubellus salinus]UWM55394.1 CPBP family intramembrane metalloprotease [Salinirubellus salinus]